jgi:NAD+ kinase
MLQIFLLSKPGKDASHVVRQLQSEGHHVSTELPHDSIDLVMSYGGDGTVLYAAQYALKYNVPLYGLFAGTLGFLCSGYCETVLEDLERLANEQADISQRMIISAHIDGKEHTIVNDLVFRNQNIAKMIQVDTCIDGEFFTNFKADGVIVATPTGSTAYNYACGGSIVDAEMDALLLTPIAPQNLFHQGTVLGGNHSIDLRSNDEGVVILDGSRTLTTSQISLTRSNQHLKLVMPQEQRFFDVVREKFHKRR